MILDNKITSVVKVDSTDSTPLQHALQHLITQLERPNFSLSAQQEIANSILTLLADSTTLLLDKHIATLATIITRSLRSLQSAANAATANSNQLRLVSTYFSLLTRISGQPSPLPSDIVSIIVTALSFWCYHTPRDLSTRRIPALDSTLALGSTGAFGSFGASPTNRRSAKSRSNSTSSLSESGSESEIDSTATDTRSAIHATSLQLALIRRD